MGVSHPGLSAFLIFYGWPGARLTMARQARSIFMSSRPASTVSLSSMGMDGGSMSIGL
jgi:hypothetical protein